MHGVRTSAARAPQRIAASARPTGRVINSRLMNNVQAAPFSAQASIARPSVVVPLRSQFLPDNIRSLHQSSRLNEAEKPKAKVPETDETTNTSEEPAKKADGKEEPQEKKEGEEEAKEKKEGEEKEDAKKEEKKEAPPPPPPHGDKSPWQVFTETLQTEFKESKDWQEGTKQLAAGANEIVESEAVKRAREAYEKSTGTIGKVGGKVLKTTAGAIGKGAAYTWETAPVKGLRHTANFTANIADKATKPIRETEAFKSVKNVIDDGSSSKYGGWVEKEERRKAREAREAALGTKFHEIPVEDPK